ncbi:MAG: phosphate-starvation-inducible PsiE family protein [Cyanobium sp. 49614_E6]|nr:phosphate-starvation-inducible PsiE family protein [Cyanobium sp. 49614_E6]
MPIPQPPGFLNLIERFERSLARVLAALLGVVLTVGTAQLCLGTAEALWRMDQNWLGGGMLALLDQLLLILIGLEVLQNLAAYLRDHSIHTELVVLTALTAVARGVVIVCLAIAYTLLRTKR